MKKVLFVLTSLFLAGGLQAQTAQRVPDYFGFYLLKIPGFTWVEGASVQGEFRRYAGVLNMDDSRAPVFVAQGRDPVPLTLNQASALALAAGSKKPFDLVGVEGKGQDPDEIPQIFFVPFYAEVYGQRINLIPTMTAPEAPARNGPQISPNAGAGGVGGRMRY